MSGAYPRARPQSGLTRTTQHAQQGSQTRKAAAMAGANLPPLPPTAADTSAARLYDEWRREVNGWREDTDRSQQATAIILERLTNRLDEHDRRIIALERAPTEQRANNATKRGLTLQEIYVMLTGLGVLAAILQPHLVWR